MKSKGEVLLLLFSIIIFLDRTTKNFLSNSCILIFCIKRATNSGAAFGLFSGQLWLLIAASIVVLALISYFWKIQKIRLPLTLLAAGTIGNLVDRLLYGSIIDVFSIAGSSSFNVSDLSNVVGALMLIAFILKRQKTNI